MENFVVNEEQAVKHLTAQLEYWKLNYTPKTSWRNIAENLHNDFKKYIAENPNELRISNQQEYETMLTYGVFGTALQQFDN